MTNKEEKIQYLFDDFALELSPRPELAEKARKQMPAKKKTRTVFVRVMAFVCRCVGGVRRNGVGIAESNKRNARHLRSK